MLTNLDQWLLNTWKRVILVFILCYKGVFIDKICFDNDILSHFQAVGSQEFIMSHYVRSDNYMDLLMVHLEYFAIPICDFDVF